MVFNRRNRTNKGGRRLNKSRRSKTMKGKGIISKSFLSKVIECSKYRDKKTVPNKEDFQLKCCGNGFSDKEKQIMLNSYNDKLKNICIDFEEENKNRPLYEFYADGSYEDDLYSGGKRQRNNRTRTKQKLNVKI